MLRNRNLELPEEHKSLVQRLENLWNLADEKMTNQNFPLSDDLRNTILLQLTAATSRVVHSALVQIKGGSPYGLDFLLRPLVEGLINYKYIKEDDTQMRARAFVADDLRSRLANIRRLIPLLERGEARGMATVTDAESYRKLENQLASEQNQLTEQYGEDNLRFSNLEERARVGNSLELYATVYWLLCQDTHLTARGLDRYMREINNQLSITWDQDLERFLIGVRTLYIIFIAFLNECSEKFGIPTKLELSPFDSIPS